MSLEPVFTAEASSIVFGLGATHQVGDRVRAAGCRRVLLVTDPRIAALPPVATAKEALIAAGVEFEVFSDVRVEPTDSSWQHAIAFATAGNFDGFV